MRASADVDVTRSDSLFVVRKSASPRRFDLLTHREGRRIGRRLTTGVDPCSREAHAPQDNCVHKSCINYGNLRCHFQDRASASIHVCPAVRGHLPGGLWCRYWPDSGDFRELRASIGPQCLRRNGFNRGSSNLVGERIEPGGHRQRSPNSAAGPRKAHVSPTLTPLACAREGRGADHGAGGRREVGGGARRQSVQTTSLRRFQRSPHSLPSRAREARGFPEALRQSDLLEPPGRRCGCWSTSPFFFSLSRVVVRSFRFGADDGAQANRF